MVPRPPPDKLHSAILRASNLSREKLRHGLTNAVCFGQVVSANWDLVYEDPRRVMPTRCCCGRILTQAYFIRHKTQGTILTLGTRCFRRIQHAVGPYRYYEALKRDITPINRTKTFLYDLLPALLVAAPFLLTLVQKGFGSI